MGLIINGWQICSAENKVCLGSEEVSLQPLCMSLLLFLSKRAGSVVERHEIIQHVWQGRVVSEDALNNSIRKIRRALGDDPRMPKLIETINKKGYRLIAKVIESEDNAHTMKARKSFLSAKSLVRYSAFICLMVGILYLLPVEIEMINISSDMSEQEKQHQYNSIMARTENGGHIIKINADGKNNP